MEDPQRDGPASEGPAGEAPPSPAEPQPTEVLGPLPSATGGTGSPPPGERQAGSPLIGTRVGSIRVERRLALGGVGELYLGFDETLRRKVVLKALRGDRRSARWRARLLREARILSRLQDPKICQIHGYIEGDGTDYLILELIDGRTLRRAARGDLAPALRMKIALEIAEVLAKAHANGVVHRDLKPSNIMLTRDGAVKVLDFGIASSAEDGPIREEEGSRWAGQPPVREAPPAGGPPDLETRPGILDEPLPEHADPADPPEESRLGSSWDVEPTVLSERLLTQTGSVLGTLAYMSPEQARGETLSPASDVYSFGLILQELFTGLRAYDRELPETELAARVLAGRSLPVTGIDRNLALLIGEMKAAAPEERPTSAAVARRLRWIRDKPRRRLRRLAAAAVAIALALGVVFHERGLRRERNLALAAEKRAVAARLEAEQVVDFLERMFQGSESQRRTGETVTVREVLDRGAAQVEAELAEQPLVQARLMATMGSVYAQLSLYDGAEGLLERALEIRRAELPDGAPEIADSAARLGGLMIELSRTAEALELFEEAVAITEADPGPKSPEHVFALRGLLATRSGLSHYQEAEQLAKRILAILEETGQFGSEPAVEALRGLANAYRSQGLYEKALPHYERVRDWNEEAGGVSHSTGMTFYHLGIIYTQMGRYQEAEDAYHRCREIWHRTLGPEHSDMGKIELAMATLHRRLKRFAEAEEGFQRAMAIWEASVGEDNVYMALAANNLASVYLEEERYGEAEAYYRRALGIFEASFPSGHPNISMTLANLGQLATVRERYDEAESLLRRALAIDRELSGSEHPNVGWDLHLLANVARDRGRFGEAEALYRESFAILDPALGAEHPDVEAARKEYTRMLSGEPAGP